MNLWDRMSIIITIHYKSQIDSVAIASNMSLTIANMSCGYS